MVFSNLIFLYLFLPVCLIAYFFCPGIRAKNAVLILFSLIFYAWGEPVYLLLMIASAAVNWYFGLLIERRRKKIFLILALVLDLGCLAVFKYAGFFVENLNAVFGASIPVPQIALPIGLYTVCSLVIINLLGNFDLHVLTALFGAFLIALAAYFLLFAKRVKLDQPGLAAGLVCSAFSGCCAGAFTIGGPMMALYFVAIARSKETYVGNMQFLFFTTNLINFTMRTVRGYFSAALLPMAGLGMACILLGLWIGTRLSRKMSGDVARQVVYIGVGISGLVTLVQELMK